MWMPKFDHSSDTTFSRTKITPSFRHRGKRFHCPPRNSISLPDQFSPANIIKSMVIKNKRMILPHLDYFCLSILPEKVPAMERINGRIQKHPDYYAIERNLLSHGFRKKQTEYGTVFYAQDPTSPYWGLLINKYQHSYTIRASQAFVARAYKTWIFHTNAHHPIVVVHNAIKQLFGDLSNMVIRLQNYELSWDINACNTELKEEVGQAMRLAVIDSPSPKADYYESRSIKGLRRSKVSGAIGQREYNKTKHINDVIKSSHHASYAYAAATAVGELLTSIGFKRVTRAEYFNKKQAVRAGSKDIIYNIVNSWISGDISETTMIEHLDDASYELFMNKFSDINDHNYEIIRFGEIRGKLGAERVVAGSEPRPVGRTRTRTRTGTRRGSTANSTGNINNTGTTNNIIPADRNNTDLNSTGSTNNIMPADLNNTDLNSADPNICTKNTRNNIKKQRRWGEEKTNIKIYKKNLSPRPQVRPGSSPNRAGAVPKRKAGKNKAARQGQRNI